MVYLNNDNNKQDVYIPRNDGQGAYVSPCDKCYQEGYKDGCEECGNVNLEDKSVVVTAATQTVLPSSGYDAMTSVDVDATEWGQSKYDEGHDDGYDEGYGNGEDDQKARLSSATFVENGHYELENGWSAVTVQTTCPPPSLEDKNFYLESCFTPTTITPSSGYDGLSSVRVEDNGYGQERYDTGYDAGEEAQRHKLVSTAITANGIYSRADGYSQIDVQVPVEVPCNIESGVSINLINYPGYETTVVPSSGYAGLASVHADGSGIYTQGVLDVANQFVPLTATTNGVYLPQSQYAVFSSVTVNVPCTACTLQTKNDTMTASTQTFTADNLVRPTAPSGETVYGGSIVLLEDLIDQYGQIRIKAWDNAQHSDSTLVGYFQYDNGEYMFYNYQADIPYPFSSLTSSFANVGGVGFSYLFMENDGRNIFFYDTFDNGIFLDGGLTLNDLILPVDGYDGLSSITVSINNPSVESGKTLDLNSGDTSPWIVVPSSGYLSMDEVVVTDNGYGQGKYDEGYDDAWAVAMESGHTVGLQEMSCIKYVSDNQAVIAVDDYEFNTRTANVQATGNSVTIATNANVTTYRTITAQLNSPPPVSAYCYGQIDVNNRVGQIIRFNFDHNEKSHVTEVWLPEALMLMSHGIFQMYECFGSMDNLEYVHFPSALKNIVGFNSCPKLDNVVLPRRLAFITNAFNQTDIHEIEFPQTVGTIRDNVLRCSSIEKVIIRECCYIGYGFCSADSYSGFTGTDKAANLKEIYCYSTVAPIFRVDERNIELTDPNLPFANQLPNGTLYVPTGYASAYASWLDFLPSGWTISATL